MTKKEFKNKTFEEVIDVLREERCDITDYESLKDFAKHHIDEDNLNVAIHILQAIWNDEAEYYEYDYCMGTCQTPSGITTKEDLEHLI